MKFCHIDPNATITTVDIGSYTIIGKSTVNSLKIGSRVLVEDDCTLHHDSIIYDCVLITKDTIVPPNLVIPPYSKVSGVPGTNFKIERLGIGYKKLIELAAKEQSII